MGLKVANIDEQKVRSVLSESLLPEIEDVLLKVKNEIRQCKKIFTCKGIPRKLGDIFTLILSFLVFSHCVSTLSISCLIRIVKP